MSSKLSGWDFTMGVEHCADLKLRGFLKDHCKHWVFQKEAGAETGYEHWQVRISLGVARRQSELLELGRVNGMEKWHLSPTVTENRLPARAFYILKPETRIDGPWSSEDEVIYIPKQIRDIELRAWQAQIVRDATQWDQRHINVVLETVGNKGKSILVTYCGVNKIGRAIPPVNDYKDIMRIVMDMPTSSLYLVDMPRAIEQKKLREFFAGLEELKSGHAWDDRYSFKEKWFDSPNIWVFTNVMPNLNYLSADRWVIWHIIDDKLDHLNRDRQ